MSGDINGKTVLVTGASGGIGRAISVALANRKANVLLVGRDKLLLQETLDAVVLAGGSGVTLVADLLLAEDRQSVVDACEALKHGLYGVINNAGCNSFGLLQDQSEKEIRQQLDINVLVPVLLIRSLLPALLKSSNARILNIGSSFGSIGYPGYTAYCASKFGLRGFTEALRRELADTTLSVMYLAPRATITRLNADNVVAMNREMGNAMDSPDFVAQKAVLLFVRGDISQVFIGWPEKLFVRINAILPGLVDGALKKHLAVIKRFAAKT
jgi:short-subunit dehydrogenase